MQLRSKGEGVDSFEHSIWVRIKHALQSLQ